MAVLANSARKLGYADYAAIPADGRRHEIVGGAHHVNPAPNLYHQAISKRLQYQLYTKIELAGQGFVYPAPLDVQLSEYDIVQPDLVVVLSPRAAILTPTKVKGAPDLLVEILSPSTRDYDGGVKRHLYERSGVREYWIVDPEEHSLEQLVLVSGAYRARCISDRVLAEFLAGIEIDLAAVW